MVADWLEGIEDANEEPRVLDLARGAAARALPPLVPVPFPNGDKHEMLVMRDMGFGTIEQYRYYMLRIQQIQEEIQADRSKPPTQEQLDEITQYEMDLCCLILPTAPQDVLRDPEQFRPHHRKRLIDHFLIESGVTRAAVTPTPMQRAAPVQTPTSPPTPTPTSTLAPTPEESNSSTGSKTGTRKRSQRSDTATTEK